MTYGSDYINGFIERKAGGKHEGRVTIDGILLDDIEGMYFEVNNRKHLWLKRKPVMEYDFKKGAFKTRQAVPYWETYLEKVYGDGTVAYKGECVFMRFRYSVTGVWDAVLGKDKQRLNLFIERLPEQQQTIIKSINENNKKRIK